MAESKARQDTAEPTEAVALFEVMQAYNADEGEDTAPVGVIVLRPVAVARSRSGRRKSDETIPPVTALLGQSLELHVHDDSALADLEAGDRVAIRLAVEVL